MIADPRAYVFALVGAEGTPAGDDPTWHKKLIDVEPEIFAAGFGQEVNAAGPRGRLFLPWSGCRNCAPTPEERARGLHATDRPEAFVLFVDIVVGWPADSRWGWILRPGLPAYVAAELGPSTEPPPPIIEVDAIQQLRADVHAIRDLLERAADRFLR